MGLLDHNYDVISRVTPLLPPRLPDFSTRPNIGVGSANSLSTSRAPRPRGSGPLVGPDTPPNLLVDCPCNTARGRRVTGGVCSATERCLGALKLGALTCVQAPRREGRGAPW
jgi:hypothetical protein